MFILADSENCVESDLSWYRGDGAEEVVSIPRSLISIIGDYEGSS
jgi:hypothetical protein